MHHNSKQLQQLQADLIATCAEIHKLQQENDSLRKPFATLFSSMNPLIVKPNMLTKHVFIESA